MKEEFISGKSIPLVIERDKDVLNFDPIKFLMKLVRVRGLHPDIVSSTASDVDS